MFFLISAVNSSIAACASPGFRPYAEPISCISTPSSFFRNGIECNGSVVLVEERAELRNDQSLVGFQVVRYNFVDHGSQSLDLISKIGLFRNRNNSRTYFRSFGMGIRRKKIKAKIKINSAELLFLLKRIVFFASYKLNVASLLRSLSDEVAGADWS